MRAAVVNSPLVDTGVVPAAWSRLVNEDAVRSALSYVPASASVFTTNHYAPHLSQRYTLHVFAYPEDVEQIGDVDTVLLNLKDHRSVISELSCGDYRQFLETAASHGFGIVFTGEGAVVLRRGEGRNLSARVIDDLMETCNGVPLR